MPLPIAINVPNVPAPWNITLAILLKSSRLRRPVLHKKQTRMNTMLCKPDYEGSANYLQHVN